LGWVSAHPFFEELMAVTRTRLRFIRSKDLDKIMHYVNVLIPYKVEIKGNPYFAQKKWHLFFVLPENENLKEVPFGDLD
jgi:hypothetical protein